MRYEAMPYGIAGLLTLVAMVAVWAYWPARGLPDNVEIDRIVVDKSARRLEVVSDDRVIAVYPIALGREPVGAKRELGDGRTPEGEYIIDFHKRDSAYHRALHISYPAPRDVAAADRLRSVPGGSIMIHGLKPGLGRFGRFHTLMDWTDGCIAVTNSEIEQLFRVVANGTPIHIRA
jgi:murein L,D-transpeptidase YafK